MKRLAVTLAVVMISLLAPTTEVRAAGNGLTPYITDLMLIGKNNKSEAEALKAQYVKDGWTAIEQDLNEGCGSKSDYIFLLYKVGNLASANQSFITDIYITTDGTSDINATRTINDREYKLVPYDGDEHFMEKKGDLNSNAGGDDIHLYYTTDNYTDAKAISSIAFNKTQSDAVGKNGDNSKGYDLNTGTRGYDIYMHCTRNYAPQWIIEKSTDGGRCIIRGFREPARGIKKGDIKAFPSIIGGTQVVASSLNYKDFPNIETIYVNDNFNFEVMLPINTEGNELLEHIHVVDEGGKVIRPDELPASVRNIPNDAFYKCTSLTKVTIPGSVKSIGQDAFSGCKSLISVTIKDGVKSIGQGAFYGCKLTSITIPRSVESIGQSAFSGCSALTSITITNGVKSIGQEAFSGCSALTSITIPVSVESIGENAFKGCSKLQIIYVYPDNPNYKEIDGVLFDKAGTTILVFPPAYQFTNYVIPNGVTNIGQYAFYGCTSLTSITIPSSMTSIAENTFWSCNKLKAIYVNSDNPNYKSVDGVLLDKAGATILLFPRAYPNKDYVIPDGVTNIGTIFAGRTDLTGITIPGSVESIGQGAFFECTGLKSVTIKDGVKSIGQEAFWGCTSLKSVTIKDGVKSIGQSAFNGCTSLTSVTIENGVESIGQGAFMHCTGLTNITIPGSVESIGQEAFRECTSLKSVTIKDGVESIGQNAFLFCDNLASVSIMGNPKMGDGAIPKGVTVTLNLTANAANGAKWMTFYNDRYNFQADANTTVYKATVVGQSLVLTEVADRIVNGVEWYFDEATDPATAVILKSTGNPVMTRVTGRSSDGQANALFGTMEATATPANCFTLASGSKGVGFYHYTGSEVAAGKAYLIYSGTSAAREFIGFDEGGEATGISTITVPATLEGNGSAWYGLDGRKLQGEPTRKGIYMRNDRKVVIK